MNDGPSRIGVDIGGTFTDVAAVRPDGTLFVGKRLTTHGAEADGVIAAVADTRFDLTTRDLIVAHGTTLVINALLERRGARVGFVTTEGFADVLDIARANRTEGFNLRYRRDPPLVPRELRFEIHERTHAGGAVEHRPTAEQLSELTDRLRLAGVEAVAVAFLNSYVDPSNEEDVAEEIRRELGVPVTSSSELSRQWREYERFSTAAANAYVSPVADRYVQRLLGGLGDQGFAGQFVILDSSGGAITADAARRFPVRTVESGPVAGVIGARSLAEELGLDNLVVFDMGGTTSKVSLVEHGEYATTNLYWVGGRGRGFPLQVNTVDVVEVSIGGGSIAWLDEAGRLRVGARSAGSQPGPACYGLGAVEATVTDADLYCGRLDKEHFVGQLQLDAGAAAAAIERLAVEASMEPERLALGILRLANMQIAAAIRRQTLERGRDPQDFALLAIGGAGPMHGCEAAAEAGIGRVLIPRFAGHYSALGMLRANLRVDRREIMLRLLDDLDGEHLKRSVDRIAGDLKERLRFGVESEVEVEVDIQHFLALRYRGQEHTVRVATTQAGAAARPVVEQIRLAFETEYIRRYGHLDTTSEIEIVELEVIGERVLPHVVARGDAGVEGPSGEVLSRWAHGVEPRPATVISRAALSDHDHVSGPAVIYEDGSTAVIPPGATVEVATSGTLMIDTTELAVD